MKPSCQVAALENAYSDMDDLCGEIIATIQVNIEAGNISGIATSHLTNFVEDWKNKRKKIQEANR